MEAFELGTELDSVSMFQLLDPNLKVNLADGNRGLVQQCRDILEEKISLNEPIYGVSTGFGHLANKFIPKDQIALLQVNLIRSHAAGLGAEIPPNITRIAMILLANSLAKGHSGIRLETLDLLIFMINNDIIPVTYQFGSLGASGDLAPLAHVALALIGEGEVIYQNHRYVSHNLFGKLDKKTISLEAKEGLALINGTHFITAFSLQLLQDAKNLVLHNLLGTSLSIEATRGTIRAFDARISSVRRQPGQIITANILHQLLIGSEIIHSHQDVAADHKVQDPYVFRCAPQVTGAILDGIKYLQTAVSYEVNAVTDNPLIFVETKEIISGGNFHAEPLALPLETLAMAMIELANITERRIDRLVHPNTPELPSFLAKNPGVESGYMIPHYTSAAILNRLRVLAHPAVTDNTPVSGSQEDHVSNGMNSATKAHEILNLSQQIIALEIYLAVRGLNLQEGRPQSSEVLEKIVEVVNAEIPHEENDHYVRPKMLAAHSMLQENKLIGIITKYVDTSLY